MSNVYNGRPFLGEKQVYVVRFSDGTEAPTIAFDAHRAKVVASRTLHRPIETVVSVTVKKALPPENK